MPKKVICLNPKDYSITKDKEYEVLDENSKQFIIINDNFARVSYNKKLFSIKKEAPEYTITSRIEFLGVGTNGLNLSMVKKDSRRFEIEICKIITSSTDPNVEDTKIIEHFIFQDDAVINRIPSSCGIMSLQGVNSIISNLTNLVENKMSYIFKTYRSLCLDIDYITLKERVKQFLINNILLEIVNNTSCAMFIFSTTSESLNGEFQNFTEYLDEIDIEYHYTRNLMNPNSGNRIDTVIVIKN